MNCQEFHAYWNALLDQERTPRHPRNDWTDNGLQAEFGREAAAVEHARQCDNCQPAQLGYERLRQALQHWPRPSVAAPVPGLVDRIVVSSASARASRWRFGVTAPLATAAAQGLSVAAALLLAVGTVAWKWDLQEVPHQADRAGTPRAVAAAPPSSSPAVMPLGSALAVATEATWDLAWATSSPAARLGREVLDTATHAEGPTAASADGTPPAPAFRSRLPAIATLFRDFPDARPGADWLQDAGDGLAASVRPFSATAQQAFRFLRPPMLRRGGSPATAPAAKGA